MRIWQLSVGIVLLAATVSGAVSGETTDPVGIEHNEHLAENVSISSPDENTTFYRGDIVPIALSFEKTDRGTVRLSNQNGVTLTTTVEDTDRDGRAVIYLNTFQVGNETRQHGFFAREDGTTVVSTDTANTIQADGPGGDGVIPNGTYNIRTAVGDESPANETTDQVTVTLANPATVYNTIEEFTQTDDHVSLWRAPGTGTNSFDPLAVRHIRDKLGDPFVPLANDTESNALNHPRYGPVTSEEYLLLGFPSHGLEGILHETALLHPEIDNPGAVLNTTNHSVRTKAFFETELVQENIGASGPVFNFTTTEILAGPQRVPFVFDQENYTKRVYATATENANIDTYYIPFQLKEADERFTASNPILPSFVASRLTVQPVGQTGQDTAAQGNNLFTHKQGVTSRYEWREPWSTVRSETDRVRVSSSSNVTLSGQTNVVPGTRLTVTVSTLENESVQLEQTYTTTVEHDSERRSNWSVTADLSAYPVDTDIEIAVRREGDDRLLTHNEGDRAPVPGLITESSNETETPAETETPEKTETPHETDTRDATETETPDATETETPGTETQVPETPHTPSETAAKTDSPSETDTETAAQTDSATESTATETASGDGGGPGFGVAAVGLGFLSLVVLARRRQH